MLKEGQKAPSFHLSDSYGNKVKLNDFKGKKVVLYFYPKDDTSGCTREGQEFTTQIKKFKAKNTEILGVSKDSKESHIKFCDKYDLKITLLSDEDKKTIQDYGVWQEKMNYGKKYMGVVRTTYLIDENGKIEKIWNKVKVG